MKIPLYLKCVAGVGWSRHWLRALKLLAGSTSSGQRVEYMTMFIYVVKPRGIVGRYQHFGRTHCLHLQP